MNGRDANMLHANRVSGTRLLLLLLLLLACDYNVCFRWTSLSAICGCSSHW